MTEDRRQKTENRRQLRRVGAAMRKQPNPGWSRNLHQPYANYMLNTDYTKICKNRGDGLFVRQVSMTQVKFFMQASYREFQIFFVYNHGNLDFRG